MSLPNLFQVTQLVSGRAWVLIQLPGFRVCALISSVLGKRAEEHLVSARAFKLSPFFR